MVDYYKKYFLDVKPIVYDNLIPDYITYDPETKHNCFSIKTIDLPIPILVGDILRIKSNDYRIITMNGHLLDTIFVCRKIDKKNNPEDYVKRFIEMED